MNLISYDSETHLIQPGLLAPPMVCASSYDGTVAKLYTKEQGLDALEHWLGLTSVTLGGANIAYDFGVAAVARPRLLPAIFAKYDQGLVVDTHILEALHDVGRGCLLRDPATMVEFKRYSLQMLEQRYLNLDREEAKHGENAWRLRYAELEPIPIEDWPHDAKQYPLDDAIGTWKVLDHQLNAPDRFNLHCAHYEAAAAWALHLASMWGVRTDPGKVEAEIARIKTAYDEGMRRFMKAGFIRLRKIKRVDGELERADLTALGGEPIGETETKKGIKYHFAKPGDQLRFTEHKASLAELVTKAYQGNPPRTPASKTHPDGQVSTSGDTLDESDDELLETYAEVKPTGKLLSTYVPILSQGTTVPINPEVNLILNSDRISMRKPNLQQLPRKGKIRECFVPREGWVYCSVDYSAVESCTLAQVCLNWFGHSKMADAINAGQDLHARLAGRFLGLEYDEAIARKKAKDPELLRLRQAAKPVNFGLPGLMGPARLVLQARKDGVRFCELAGLSNKDECGLNEKVTEYYDKPIPPVCCKCFQLAIKFKKLFFEEWPEVSEYHDRTKFLAQIGRPIKSEGNGMLRQEEMAGSVANHFFQNLAAQGMKRALYALSRECYIDRRSVLFDNCRPVLAVHDEAITEIRREVQHEAAYRKTEVMVAGIQEVVPDVKITAEPALMGCWYKAAEAKFNDEGRLIPWEPELKAA